MGGAICMVCHSFRPDGRLRCACEARRHSAARLALNLRCSWCKQLFPWAPHRHIRLDPATQWPARMPSVCSTRCRARLLDHERWRALVKATLL